MAKTLVFDGVRVEVDAVLVEPVLRLGLAVARLRQPERISLPAVMNGSPVLWKAVLGPTTTLGVIDDRAVPDLRIAGSEDAASAMLTRVAQLDEQPFASGPDVLDAWSGLD